MRMVLLTILAILPALAFAMPAAIPALMVIAGATAAQVAIASLVIMAGSMVYGNAKKRREARRLRADYNANLSDRTVSLALEDSPHRLVYGRAKVGSAVVAFLTGGDKDQYKYLVCVHASHEIDGYESFFVAGKPCGPLDANGDAQGDDFYYEVSHHYGNLVSGSSHVLPAATVAGTINVVCNFGEGDVGVPFTYDSATNRVSVLISTSFLIYVSCQYKTAHSRVRIRTHHGTPNDPADAMLLAEVGGQWSPSAVLRGHAYTVVRLDLNHPEFQGGPVSVEVLIRGKKLYDFRTGATAWSQNNALVVYDYLLSEFCGVEPDELPMDQFIAAANVCDEVIGGGIAGPVKRYTFNGSITADEDQRQVLEKMAQSMAGEIVDTTWDIWAGTYTAPVMDLLQSDIVGKMQINSGASNGAVYNGVKGRYISDETRYVATDFKPYQNATYLAADAEEIWTNIDFPFTDTTQRVHNLSRIFVEDQRNGLTADVEFSLKAWKVKVGQRIRLTAAFWGWNTKVFRVIDKKYGPGAPVKLSLKEDAASIWDFADAVTLDDTPNTNLPNPFWINKLASLNCTSGTSDLFIAQDGTIVSRIRATWPQATTAAVVTNGLIEIEWKRTGSTVWQKTDVKGDLTEAFLSPVEDNAYYSIRARATNPTLNVKSDWTYAQDHKVVGKTAPPSDVTGFAAQLSGDRILLTWNSVPDADLGEYEIRKGNTWEAGEFVARVKTTGHKVQPLPAGTHTWHIKAFDRSKNPSVNIASATVTIVAPAAPAVSAQVVARQAVIDWTEPVASFAITGYEIRYGDTWAGGTFVTKLQARTIALDIDWGVSRRFWVAAYDAANNLGTPGSAILTLQALSQPTITAQVIDNNVLLSWTESTGSLPVKHYEVRKGATLDTSTLIGTLQGRFSTVFESTSGSYTYWVVPFDTANQPGAAASRTTTVYQPPDFRLLYDQNSAFAGTKSSAILDDGALIAPVNTTETWEQHFTSRGWTSPQQQINAGYPYYLQPTPATAFYEEVIDYGTTVASTNITVTPAFTHIVEGVTITPTISISATAGGPWIDFASAYQAFATNFRYVKVRLDFSQTGDKALVRVDSMNVRLAFKTKSDGGKGSASAADVGGTQVNFTESFVDIESITVTPQSTTPVFWGYDFLDEPNPTGFKIYIWNSAGTRVNCPFSWAAKGV